MIAGQAHHPPMQGVTKSAEKRLRDLIGTVPEIPPVQELLGATLVDVDEGEATFEMDADDRFENVINVTHGGIVTSLAELAASTAIVTTLDDAEAFTFVSQTTNYERPVRDDKIQARAEIVRRGSRISFITVHVEDEDGEESARAEFTALIQQIG